MGLLDKAKDLIGGNQGKAKQGVSKAADVADDQTGGKYTDKVDLGEDKAHDVIEGMDDK